MAKFSARGHKVVAAYEIEDGTRWSLRSDYAVLRQFRIAGKLERPQVICHPSRPIKYADFAAFCARQGATKTVSS